MADLTQLSEIVVLAIKAAQAPLLAQLAELKQQARDFDARLQESATVRDRVAALEIKQGLPVSPDLELRDRLTALETKQAQPANEDTDLLDVLHRLRTVEASAADWEGPITIHTSQITELNKDIGVLRERLAVAEVRQPMPGPAGPAGKDGRDGKDGADGFGFDDIDVGLEGDRTMVVKFSKGDRVKAFPVPLKYVRWVGVYQDGVTYTPGDAVTWAGSSWHCNEETTSKPGDGNKAWTLWVKRGRDGRDGIDAPSIPVVRVK